MEELSELMLCFVCSEKLTCEGDVLSCRKDHWFCEKCFPGLERCPARGCSGEKFSKKKMTVMKLHWTKYNIINCLN